MASQADLSALPLDSTAIAAAWPCAIESSIVSGPVADPATSRPGVFVAGSATGPETIDDSIAQGHAAAMSVLSDLHRPVDKTA